MNTRKERISELIDKIHEVPISEIVSTKMELIHSGGQHKGLCPFHDDKTIGSFVVTNKKGLFKCFSCSAGGDSIKFVAMHDGINYVQSALKIAANLNMVSEKEYEILSKRKLDQATVQSYERKSLDKFQPNPVADDETLNYVYNIFRRGQSLADSAEPTLSQEHRALLHERQLSDEEIERYGYFTMPNRYAMKGIKTALKRRGQDEDMLLNVPGFYKDLSVGKVTFSPVKGIGIPIRNIKGQIVGIQVRRDDKKEGEQRYRWFSSAFADNDDSNKYEGGSSPGSPLDVIYPKDVSSRTVFITEGHFKAVQLTKRYGCISISVQGVTSWKSMAEALKGISQTHLVKYVYIAFDADMSYNFAVSLQSRKMTDDIKKSMDVQIVYVQWNTDYGKGIDDMLASGHEAQLLKSKKEEYDSIYDEFIAHLYKHFEVDVSETNIQKAFGHISQEKIKEAYDGFILPKMTQTKSK